MNETECVATSHQVSSGSLFDQLRKLGNTVETGIMTVRQQLDSKPEPGCHESHQQAINLLLRKKMELEELRTSASTQVSQLSEHNNKMARVNELFNKILEHQSERLEKVEVYLEKYGYERPLSESDVEEELAQNSSVINATYDVEGQEVKAQIECQLDNENSAASSSPAHTSSDRNEATVLKTPVLDDYDISESTLLLIKNFPRNRYGQQSLTRLGEVKQESTPKFESLARFPPSMNFTSSGVKTGEPYPLTKTPEPPTLLSHKNLSKFYSSKDKNSSSHGPGPSCFMNNSQSMSNFSKNQSNIGVKNFGQDLSLKYLSDRTPEKPVLLTSSFKSVHAGNIQNDEKTLTTAENMPVFSSEYRSSTPEAPSFLNHQNVKIAPYGDKPASEVYRIKTPEAPNLYSYRGSAHSILSSIENKNYTPRNLETTYRSDYLHLKLQGYSQSVLGSRHSQPEMSPVSLTTRKTQDLSKHWTSEAKLNSMKGRHEDENSLNFSADLPMRPQGYIMMDAVTKTPERPAVLTGNFSFNLHFGRPEMTLTETAAQTPRTPKFQAPALQMNALSGTRYDYSKFNPSSASKLSSVGRMTGTPSRGKEINLPRGSRW